MQTLSTCEEAKRCPYHCRRTPASGPQPHCGPAGVPGPCTECTGLHGAAAAASLTARPGGSRSRGCWSAGDCVRRWTPRFKLGRTNRKVTCPSSSHLQQANQFINKDLLLKVWELNAYKKNYISSKMNFYLWSRSLQK